jgi:hypothetical protein
LPDLRRKANSLFFDAMFFPLQRKPTGVTFMLKRTGCAIAACLTVALATNVFAQGTSAAGDYPRKPVTTLMGFSPGGGSDVMLSMVRAQLE